jgi:hypothetical protein
MPSQKKRDPLFMELKDQLLLNVNPSSIKYIGKLRPWQRNFNLLKKMHLAWLYDLLKSDSGLIINHKIEYRLFADSRKYIFMKELWDFDLDYRKTGWYSSLKQKIDKGKVIAMPVKGYHISNHQQLKDYCLDYVNLLQSMKNDGFIPDKGKDAIGVNIGPEGRLLKSSKGRHRLAAAQLVGVERVPVRVKCIHKKWVDSQQPGNRNDMTLKQKIIMALLATEKRHSSA